MVFMVQDSRTMRVLDKLILWLRSAWLRSGTAGDEARTRDVHLGKVVLYQLSYTRSFKSKQLHSRDLERILKVISICIDTNI